MNNVYLYNEEEESLEKVIIKKGLTAPRLTPSAIDDIIVDVSYFVVPNTTCTICSLILQNGYVVVGKSAAVSMANFDAEIGREVAFKDARDQIWALEGYLMRQHLYEEA